MGRINEAIISIQPKYAQAILRGEKTIELRRRIPKLQIGTRLWIYATRPKAAIVGSAIVAEIFRETPTAIWESWKSNVCIDRKSYNKYFQDSDVAIAIQLTNVFTYHPIEIEKLREIKLGFHPPQVLVHITETVSQSLSKLARKT